MTEKDVKPHLSPTLLFRKPHHLLSTHHHHPIFLLSLSLSPNQAAMSNVKVILRNAVQAPTRSQAKPPFNVDSFIKSHNATPHSREWTATGYAPLRMLEDTDQMETANYTTRSNKSTLHAATNHCVCSEDKFQIINHRIALGN